MVSGCTGAWVDNVTRCAIGTNGTYNTGIEYANGDYIAWECAMYITPTRSKKACPNAMTGRCYEQKVASVRYKIAQVMAAHMNSINILYMARNKLSLLII